MKIRWLVLTIAICLVPYWLLGQTGQEYAWESYSLLKQRRPLPSGQRSLKMVLDELHSRWGMNVLSDLTQPPKRKLMLPAKTYSLHDYLLAVGNGLGYTADLSPCTKVILLRPFPNWKTLAQKIMDASLSPPNPVKTSDITAALSRYFPGKVEINFEALDEATQEALLRWHWQSVYQKVALHQMYAKDIRKANTMQVSVTEVNPQKRSLILRWQGKRSHGEIKWLIGGERFLLSQPEPIESQSKEEKISGNVAKLVPPQPKSVRYGALATDRKLQKLLKVQSDEMSLEAVIKSVQKQTSVSLGIHPSVRQSQHRVAVRFHGKGWILLQGLADLYGLVWVTKGEGYELCLDGRNPFAELGTALAKIPCWWGKSPWVTEVGLEEAFQVARKVADAMDKQKLSSGWMDLTSLSPNLREGLREAAVIRTVGTTIMYARTALPDYITLSLLRARQVIPHKGQPFWQVDWFGRYGDLLATFPLPRQIQPLP